VRWIRNDRVGLEFAQETHLEGPPDEVATVLRQVIERSFPDIEFEDSGPALESEPQPKKQHQGDENRGAPRHPLIWSGVLHHDYQSSPVRIRNISATGAMIQTDTAVRVGAEPLFELSGDVSLSATVEWAVGDQVGISFQTPFDMKALTESRPSVASGKWSPPRYLDLRGEQDESQDHWNRLTVPELRTELESFLKR
jgi:PilZ domain